MGENIIEAVQKEVARIIYETATEQAERAIREQDAVALVQMLPELKGM